MKKPITEERGWIPSQNLMTAEEYAEYVQKKLNEKIDKLPVFESKYKKSWYLFCQTFFLIRLIYIFFLFI